MSDAFHQVVADLACDDILEQAATLMRQYPDATRAAAPVQAAYQRVEAAHRQSAARALWRRWKRRRGSDDALRQRGNCRC